MNRIYLRVISNNFGVECCHRIKVAFVEKISHIEVRDVNFGSMTPYWKIDGFGEININFLSDCGVEIVKPLLSDFWDDDVADSRRARIFCGDVVFMWVYV